MKSSQKGFSVVEILVVIVIVGLLGTVGWLVYDRQSNKVEESQASSQSDLADSQSTENSDQPTIQEPKKEYKDDVADYSFSYLSDWKLGENERVEKQPRAYLESPDHKVEGQGYGSKQLSGISISFSGTGIPQPDRTADNIGDIGSYACDYDKKVLTFNGKKVFQCKNDTLGRQITITVFFKDNGLRIDVVKYGLKEQESTYLEAYNDILNSLKY